MLQQIRRSHPSRAMMHGTVVAGAALCVGLSGQVMAQDWPSVIEKMPDGAQIILCTKPISKLNDSYMQFINAIELGRLGFMPGPVDGLAMMGMNTAAMDLEQSIGLAIMGDRWDAEIPPVLGFIPVKDYQGWTAAFGAEAVDNSNVSKMTFGPDQETWYVRSSGAYAIVGMDQNLVSNYKAGNGNVGKWAGLAGELGTGIVRDCSIAALVDFNGLRDKIKEGMNEGFDQAINEMGMMGAAMGPGMDPEQLKQMMTSYRELLNQAVDDLNAAAIGIRMNANGAAIDFGLQWIPDSKMAGLMPGPDAGTTDYLNRFEDRPFMFAFNMDGKGIRTDEIFNMFMKDMPEQMTMGLGNMAPEMWDNVKGMSMVMYPSPAGIMGGFYNSAAQYLAGDAKAIRTSMKNMLEKMNGMEYQGVKFTVEYGENAKEIAGKKVDQYTMSVEGDSPMAMQMQQGFAMMYGPAGPGGYIAETDNGVIMTMSRNSRLLESLIESAGKNEGLGTNRVLDQVDRMLSPNPSATMYLGVGTILEQVGPMMAMFMPGLQMDPELLQNMPPLAGSLSFAGGGLRGTFAAPAPTVKAGIDIAMQAQNAMQMNNGNAGDDEEPEIF